MRVCGRILRGGIAVGNITELVGESTAGKTQFSLQLLVTAQLPPSLGGLGGRSLYIHTEPQNSGALVDRLRRLAARFAPEREEQARARRAGLRGLCHTPQRAAAPLPPVLPPAPDGAAGGLARRRTSCARAYSYRRRSTARSSCGKSCNRHALHTESGGSASGPRVEVVAPTSARTRSEAPLD